MVIDDAISTESPLPLVKVEFHVVAALFSDAKLACRQLSADQLLTTGIRAQCVQVASHGFIEGASPSGEAHGTLVLDSRSGKLLHASQVPTLPHGVSEFVASACVAGMTGSTTAGDAVGLPAALLLRGVQLVGCVAPVPDLSMPTFAALYWHARLFEWKAPRAATKAARERLMTGDWPTRVIQLLSAAYHDQLHLILQAVAVLSDEPHDKIAHVLAKSVVAGVVSSRDPLSTLEPRQFAAQCCRNVSVRQRFIDAVLRRVVHSRHQPDAELRELNEQVYACTLCWG